MKKKRTTNMRIDAETLEELKRMKRELSVIENREIPTREIINRIIKGKDIKERLKVGSMERIRRGLR